jgi:hypothetical protein
MYTTKEDYFSRDPVPETTLDKLHHGVETDLTDSANLSLESKLKPVAQHKCVRSFITGLFSPRSATAITYGSYIGRLLLVVNSFFNCSLRIGDNANLVWGDITFAKVSNNSTIHFDAVGTLSSRKGTYGTSGPPITKLLWIFPPDLLLEDIRTLLLICAVYYNVLVDNTTIDDLFTVPPTPKGMKLLIK